MRVGRETQKNKNPFCCTYYSFWISFMEIWPLASGSNNILLEESMIHWNGALQYLWKGKLGRTQKQLSCGKPIQGATATQRISIHSKKQQKGTKYFQGNVWMWCWSQVRNYYCISLSGEGHRGSVEGEYPVIWKWIGFFISINVMIRTGPCTCWIKT